MSMLRISMPEIVNQGDTTVVRALVDFGESKDHLWYSVPSEYADYVVTERGDAFLVGMLLPAMARKKDIHVTGPVSEQLLYSLNKYYTKLFSILVPGLHRPMITADATDTSSVRRDKAGVVTGFSGGVDSFCVLADHYAGAVPESFKVTHLIFNNVGSHGSGGRRVFEERYKRLLPAAREMGLPFIKIDSNLNEFMSLDFLLSHVPANASAILVLQKLFARYYYAAGYSYDCCVIKATDAIATVDPATVHLLSTENTQIISSGCEYTRVEKTRRLLDMPLTRSHINVCVKPLEGGANCSACWKCARTLLTLDILGRLDQYKAVFDLEKYARTKRTLAGMTLCDKSPLAREIVDLARKNNWRFPIFSRSRYLLALAYLTAGRFLSALQKHGICGIAKRIVRKYVLKSEGVFPERN